MAKSEAAPSASGLVESNLENAAQPLATASQLFEMVEKNWRKRMGVEPIIAIER